jgi:hypothetical protein
MANKRPTHLKLLFTRTVRVQKAHIAGSKAPEGQHDLMAIMERGMEANITFPEACDLVLADSALEIKASNADAIADAKASIAAQHRQTTAAVGRPAAGKKQLVDA